MALKVPNVGELTFLDWMVKATTTPPDMTLRLFSNDHTPADADTVANYTEATFGGYAGKSLARGSWNAPATNGDGKAEIEYSAAQTWNATSAETIYGYYVTENTGNTLVYAERFASSRPLANGDSLSITPKITLKTEN